MLNFDISSREFFEQTFERAPRLWRNALPRLRPEWRELDQALQSVEPDETLFQLYLDGLLPLSQYVSERPEMGRHRRTLDKHRFFALLHRGATLVVNRFEQCSLLARRLCDEVGRFTGIATSSNSYATWTGNGTFGKHWDTHDVFVVQLIGRKSWRIHPPSLPLPLSHQTSKTSQLPCPPQVHLECVLEAGDILYIPRGWWHDVTPMNTGSWHVSVGVYTHTVTDYLSWLCGQLLPHLPEARRGAHRPPNAQQLSAVLQQLSKAALDPGSFREFSSAMQQRNLPHGELNTAVFMPDAGDMDDAHLLVARATPHAVPLERGEIHSPTGTLRLDPLKHDILAVLNQVQDIALAQLITQLAHYPAAAIRDAIRQLAVLEVVALIQLGP